MVEPSQQFLQNFQACNLEGGSGDQGMHTFPFPNKTTFIVHSPGFEANTRHIFQYVTSTEASEVLNVSSGRVITHAQEDHIGGDRIAVNISPEYCDAEDVSPVSAADLQVTAKGPDGLRNTPGKTDELFVRVPGTHRWIPALGKPVVREGTLRGESVTLSVTEIFNENGPFYGKVTVDFGDNSAPLEMNITAVQLMEMFSDIDFVMLPIEEIERAFAKKSEREDRRHQNFLEAGEKVFEGLKKRHNSTLFGIAVVLLGSVIAYFSLNQYTKNVEAGRSGAYSHPGVVTSQPERQQ